MKAEVITGIAISAAILLLFLLYYAIKTISNCGEKSNNTIQIDEYPSVESKTKKREEKRQESLKLSEMPTPDLPKVKFEVVREGNGKLKANQTSTASTVVLAKANSTSVVSIKSVLPNSAAITTVFDIKKKVSNLQRIHNERNDGGDPQKIPVCIAETQSLISIPSYRKYTVELLRAKSDLIIAVDARPSIQAGYCVNLKDKWIQYYVVKKKDLPWHLKNGNHPVEFEMKNFIFAVTIWYEEIVTNKSLQIFTDNNEVWKCGTKYGRRIQELLKHLVICEHVAVKNISNIHINRFDDIEQFALFLKPADDLSRWKIDDAVDFLTRMYEIRMDNVTGTHLLAEPLEETTRAWYDSTSFYTEVLNKAQRQIQLFGSGCQNSSCSKILRESLRGHQAGKIRSLLTQQIDPVAIH